MRVIPVEFRQVAVLIMVTLLPLVPVVLMTIPVQELLKRVAGVLR
jgi:hypothetical protein